MKYFLQINTLLFVFSTESNNIKSSLEIVRIVLAIFWRQRKAEI